MLFTYSSVSLNSVALSVSFTHSLLIPKVGAKINSFNRDQAIAITTIKTPYFLATSSTFSLIFLLVSIYIAAPKKINLKHYLV